MWFQGEMNLEQTSPVELSYSMDSASQNWGIRIDICRYQSHERVRQRESDASERLQILKLDQILPKLSVGNLNYVHTYMRLLFLFNF